MQPPTEPDRPQPPAQYEFNSQQNQVIGDLANSMLWVAVPFMALGILYIIATVLLLIQMLRDPAIGLVAVYVGLVALLLLVLGRWTRQAAGEFQQVVATTGRDISHLMNALDNLRKFYSLLSVFVKIYVIFVVIALIASVIIHIVRAVQS
jgi:hypothetical protein